MLARFRVLLPYSFSIPCYDNLAPVEFQHGEYKVKMYPPMVGNVDPSIREVTSPLPLSQAMAKLEEVTIVAPISSIMVNDQESIQANLIRIDLLAGRDFNRKRADGIDKLDPPLELFFTFANSLIGRIRAVGQLSPAMLVTPNSAVGWRLQYLSDEEQLLPKDRALFRDYHCSTMDWSLSIVTAETWKLAHTLPIEYSPQIWDMLLLDAKAQLPDVNPAIVLANAALESFINLALDVLAKNSPLAEASWEWISRRGKDWLKQPSVKEKYDQVLFLLTGKSLRREDQKLWEAFSELRAARNSMVHQGRAVTGKQEVTPEKARELLDSAGRIIYWVEVLLPEEHRRTLFNGRAEWQFNRLMVAQDNDAEMDLVGIKSTTKNTGVKFKIEKDE